MICTHILRNVPPTMFCPMLCNVISSEFPPKMLCAVLFSVTGPLGLSMQTLKNQEWTEVSRRNNVDTNKFSVETRLEDGFAIENTYFQ